LIITSAKEKILSLSDADSWVESVKIAGSKWGFTCGAFDVMHAGHASYLSAARRLCDHLLVAVNSDDSIQRYKSVLRPVNPWNERAFVVASLASVDRVTVLEEDRPLSLIRRWKPNFYIKGGDYQASGLRSGQFVEEYGGATVVIPPGFPVSTTRMFARIQALATHALPANVESMAPAGLVLLDRDGTLVRDACFDPSRIELLPHVVEALLQLQSVGFRLCIVTNQQGIGLGYFGYREFVDGNAALLSELGTHRVNISRVYFCPHSLADGCGCRKPSPGLILRALRQEGIPAERCFVVGDRQSDVDAAVAAGCIGFRVGSARESQTPLTMLDVARRILGEFRGNTAPS
jgi:rfaE bifunctional protein nucleotidyltransferase chain/domain